jgi:polysaccharide export outer membrane protein
MNTEALPVPDATGAELGPLDKMKVEVFGVPDLTREVQVDAGGNISFPFVGPIHVAGQTPAQVEGLIERRLAGGYIKNPQVSVNLLESDSQTIAIEGEVKQPGVYPAAGRLSLLRALALAGGNTEYALREQVIIFRDVGDQRFAGVYNLDAVRRGLVDDPRVYPHDLIVMGESPRRRQIDQIIKAAPAFTSPLILLLTRL